MDLANYQECIRSFAGQQYDACIRKALPLLDTYSDPELLQIVLISLQRLGKKKLAEKIGLEGLRASQQWPWTTSLVKLTLGQVSLSDIILEAADSLQRCQAYYYAGTRYLTDGHNEAAIQALLGCQSTRADSFEAELAENTLRQLTHADSDSVAEEFDVERVRIGFEGMSDEVRILRPKGSEPVIASKPGVHIGGWLPTSDQLNEAQVTHQKPENPQKSADWCDVIRDEPGLSHRQSSEPLKIFISSTFHDMHEEREVLVKKVFPQLKAFCTKLGLDLTEVDLRWGIPEERTRDVLPICFSEIEHCHYFIALIGDRYGSVPEEIHPDIRAAFPWLKDYEDRSITELEIIYRRNSNPEAKRRSLYYFRNPEKAGSSLSEDNLIKSNPLFQKQERLKESIRKSGCCIFEDYRSPESLGQQILHDLTGLISHDFPSNRQLDQVLLERGDHEAIAAAHLRGFVPRLGYTERLEHHVLSADKPVMVVGDAGSGKSALLANWVSFHREHHPNDILVEHYVGATATSADLAALIRRLIAEIQRHYRIDPMMATFYQISETEVNPGKLIQVFHNHLFLAMRLPQQRLILVIDGLDQLEDTLAQDLWWLPKDFPPHIRVILSARQGPIVTCAEDQGWILEHLELFTEKELSQAISQYFQRYGKELGQRQINRLVGSPQLCQPLFLRVMLNELRVFGSFETIDNYIADYLEASDHVALYKKVFGRWQKDYNTPMFPTMVEVAISLLASSRNGLTESEWINILSEQSGTLPSMVWAPFFMALQEHLINRSGCWQFANVHMAHAVHNYFFMNTVDQDRYYGHLADYFSKEENNDRKFGDVPWYLFQGKDTVNLKQYLCDLDLTEYFCLYGHIPELINYWNATGSVSDMLTEFHQLMETAESSINEPERVGVYNYHIGVVCETVSQFDEAEGYYSNTLKIIHDHLGSDHPSTAVVQHRLGGILIKKNKPAEAEMMFRAALGIKEKAFGPVHTSLANTLMGLGQAFEAQQKLDVAARCYERAYEITRFQQGEIDSNTASCAAHLAVVLANEGQTDRAEEYCHRVLTITRQLPRVDNPNTWKALDVLAEILRQKKQYEEAEAIYRKILTRRKEQLGLNHPSTAMTLGRLGLIRIFQGDTINGITMCQQSLEICLQTVGPDHPYTIEIQKIFDALPPRPSASN